VLDLAGRRENLSQFLLRNSKRPQVGVENDRACGRRALINRDERSRQRKSPGNY
jgi:hypothetical protein